MLQDTSLQSYNQLRNKLGQAQQRVLDAFEEYGECTDLELCNHLREHDPNSIRPRRKELVDMGLVGEITKRNCKVSGRMAIVWGIGVFNNKNKTSCLSHTEFNNLIKKLHTANRFQRDKIIGVCKELNDD